MTGPVTGTFGATGNSGEFSAKGRVSILIDGGSAIVNIQRSTDNGVSWFTISRDSAGNPATYDTNSVSFNGFIDEPEYGVKYRLNCSAYTSGTVTYRIGGPLNA